jgi:hypothetical protein
MANALAQVVWMPNTVAHLVRTVAICLTIHLSEGGQRFDTRRLGATCRDTLHLVDICFDTYHLEEICLDTLRLEGKCPGTRRLGPKCCGTPRPDGRRMP